MAEVQVATPGTRKGRRLEVEATTINMAMAALSVLGAG